MSGLEELYKEIILDHYRNPRHQGELECPPAHKTEGFNPLCGDEVSLTFLIEEDSIKELRIAGHGCSISQASASMMASAIQNKSIEEVRDLSREFKAMMSIHEETISNTDQEPVSPAALTLGDLEALKGVVKFPVRIKCATLSWNTLLTGLDDLDT
ncbi:MAG TPA: SUF system NifU family Fe-S cluster assembly protein [Acidimicrobiaceae bacterium]|nr:SUF system NifU family Fe-S cluster assembly protein [Acidimicrobiaceae bacterium]|tara:strand:- start:168 stop:635 length:468 start_codon:yes stop_codon:yes gene_type:complete